MYANVIPGRIGRRLRDFAPVALCCATPNVLVVNPDVPARTVPELLALARAKPGELAYASAGPGSSNHLTMELLELQAGVDLLHVPYKGSAPAQLDLLGGRGQVRFDTPPMCCSRSAAASYAPWR